MRKMKLEARKPTKKEFEILGLPEGADKDQF
jgi:hypothetical protein